MHDDAELQDFREGVNCAAVLDRMGGWRLDQCQGTRRALKYRRGEGEILIINRDGRGWLDPTSQAKGDVFGLVQHFNPSLNFGQVRQALRHLVGIAPSFPTASRNRTGERDNRPVLERWAARPPLRPGSAAWRYLADERCIPPEILAAAVRLDAAREGYRGSAWFAHRRRGEVCHVEARGPDWKGSLAGGTKTLFPSGLMVWRSGAWPSPRRQSTRLASRRSNRLPLTRCTLPRAAAWDPPRSRRCKACCRGSPPPRTPFSPSPRTPTTPATAKPSSSPASRSKQVWTRRGCGRPTGSIGTMSLRNGGRDDMHARMGAAAVRLAAHRGCALRLGPDHPVKPPPWRRASRFGRETLWRRRLTLRPRRIGWCLLSAEQAGGGTCHCLGGPACRRLVA